jgi:superfamily II DNA/RNA helicase
LPILRCPLLADADISIGPTSVANDPSRPSAAKCAVMQNAASFNDVIECGSQAIAAGIALKRVYQKYQIKHAISFHRSIRAADRFREQQDALNRQLDMRPKTTNLHISSKKTAGQRTDLLREFVEHKRALMTNARCLTEGIDVPAIDCVMFADPKQSRIDIVQAAGRALSDISSFPLLSLRK